MQSGRLLTRAGREFGRNLAWMLAVYAALAARQPNTLGGTNRSELEHALFGASIA